MSALYTRALACNNMFCFMLVQSSVRNVYNVSLTGTRKEDGLDLEVCCICTHVHDPATTWGTLGTRADTRREAWLACDAFSSHGSQWADSAVDWLVAVGARHHLAAGVPGGARHLSWA